MEREGKEFSVLSKIYSHLSEENKEKLVKTAENLLKVQRKDVEKMADACSCMERKVV